MKALLDSSDTIDGMDEFSVYDHPELQKKYMARVTETGIPCSGDNSDGEQQQVILQLDNIRCAGCCSAIENAVNAIPGINTAELNYSTHRLRVTWNSKKLAISGVLRFLSEMGYPGQPVNVIALNQSVIEKRKKLIRQVGVAGALGMQIMVLSVCLYAGEWWGIDASFEVFFRYLSFLLIIPILLYSAHGFFASAYVDLRHARIGMDVPIALGLTVAFMGSIYALLTGVGDTYFDSIAMFVFLVLGARLMELNYRLKAMSSIGQYDTVMPTSAIRISGDGSPERIPTVAVQLNDQLQVNSGDVVPADGIVVSGESSFDESFLTGEALPVVACCGGRVLAGSVNIENPVRIKVTSVGEETAFSAIVQLVQKAHFDKPKVSRLVEQLSSWFVAVVLSVAAMVALLGFFGGATDGVQTWLPATISVLIVSCPCALALATPAAVAMATGKLLKQGVVVLNSRALETLAKGSHFFFDKTGTLTTGQFKVKTVSAQHDICADRAVHIARSLEQFSSHPIARAITRLNQLQVTTATDIETQPGGGIKGKVNRHQYYIGNADYIRKETGHSSPELKKTLGSIAVLADGRGVQCVFTLQDEVREGAAALVKKLMANGKKVALLSGDRESAVTEVASALGIQNVYYACSPQDKLRQVEHATQLGEVTVMLGDGINDAPVVGGAHVSVAIGERVNMTSVSADIVALNSSMQAIESVLATSSRLSLIIKQNLSWALAYNALAIPFAAVGWVPPWLAAIGMSVSSLVVVLNAARLGVDGGGNTGVAGIGSGISEREVTQLRPAA